MQKRLTILFTIISASVVLSTTALADASAVALAKADSLYKQKQYTQAFSLYQDLYKEGQYSQAMFLKMAHIQEGLNHLGESLFYLNLYFLASDDQSALKKMEELAKKNNLTGYETDETSELYKWLRENYSILTLAITSAAVFLMAALYYQRMRLSHRLLFTAFGLLAVLIVLFIHVNYSKGDPSAIVASPATYLMSGPSSGASVIAIIGEGHQLRIEGKQDVWLKVRWRNQDAWVKESLLRPVHL